MPGCIMAVLRCFIASSFHHLQKRRRPSQRWRLLRKGRPVFRREDCFDRVAFAGNYLATLILRWRRFLLELHRVTAQVACLDGVV